MDAGVDPGVLAALEERVAAAEERAREAERRLDEAKPRRSRSRATQRATGNGNGTGQENGKAKGDGDADGGVDAPAAESADQRVDAVPDELAAAEPVLDDEALEKAQVDGSELRSRLVRSTDARRRGISTPTAVPTPGPTKRR